MPNHLANETSPYLLQHANNPVNWYPWGETALQRARFEDKPILLSIGYAACHWCHVMAHESFEDETIAKMMNTWFINIKVDREERPDLDDIYMQAVVAVTGKGGWPMTVFLTPEGRPFFGGTYFPPTQRYGMPAFSQVLQSVAAAWRERRDEVNQSADQILSHLKSTLRSPMDQDAPGVTPSHLVAAFEQLGKRFDRRWGGFSPAPKFPQPMVIEFLLREYIRTGNPQALHMAEFTLDKMARGGMYDHLGGGFARYSTDEQWLVPHFEKMLYDNALLARVYLHAWQVTKKPLFRRVVEHTLDYILREMTHPNGGFYSSQDADSEGQEGKFYVWYQDEIIKLLAEDAELFSMVYGISKIGNWEGNNILHLHLTSEEAANKMGVELDELESRLNSASKKLFTARQRRIHPGLDDKVLTSWNGLAMAAFAEAGCILDRADYLEAATRNAEFIYQTMQNSDGRLYRTWKSGSAARYNAFLEDYACLADGLLALYQANFDLRWFDWACTLADQILANFQDHENGGFYDTSDNHEQLIQRPKDLEDNAIPSGNARSVHILLLLALFTGNSTYEQKAVDALKMVSGLLDRFPFGFGEWLSAATLRLSQPREVALVGDLPGLAPFLEAIRSTYRPFMVLTAAQPGSNNPIPLLADRPMVDGLPTAYICRNFVCQAPVTDPKGFVELLE